MQEEIEDSDLPEEDTLRKLLDNRVTWNDAEQGVAMMKIALKCLEDKVSRRPEIRQVFMWMSSKESSA